MVIPKGLLLLLSLRSQWLRDYAMWKPLSCRPIGAPKTRMVDHAKKATLVHSAGGNFRQCFYAIL